MNAALNFLFLRVSLTFALCFETKNHHNHRSHHRAAPRAAAARALRTRPGGRTRTPLSSN
jgi:hypothetical protein